MKIFSTLLFLSMTIVVFGQSGMVNHGEMLIHTEGQLAVHGYTNFNSGKSSINATERRPDIGTYIFVQDGKWESANDSNYVDGYIEYRGTDDFIFPVGDDGRFRPFAVQNISGPITGAYYDVDASLAITSDAAANNLYPVLPNTGPFDRTIMDLDLLEVSPFGYWDINGDDPINVHLTWSAGDDISGLTITEIDRLTIVGWRNGQWEKINSTLDSKELDTSSDELRYLNNNTSLIAGSIRSQAFIPSRYAVITLGSLKCKRGFEPVIMDATDPEICGTPTGSFVITNAAPLETYTLSYTLNGEMNSLSFETNDQGRYQLDNLSAGAYTEIILEDGICGKRLTPITLLEDTSKDTDNDGLTDCEEVARNSNPLDPCDPNPLGNLDADCDGDGVPNAQDCAAQIIGIQALRICDDGEVEMTLDYTVEPWLGSPTISFEWYDGDPTATPAAGTLIDTQQNPTLPLQPKSNNEFYVQATIAGCPAPALGFVDVNLIDLDPSADQYDLDYSRDTTYILEVLSNDNLLAQDIELFIIDQASHGSVSINPDGTINYFTNSGYFGVDAFTYAVCDPVCTEICEEVNVILNIQSTSCDFIPSGFSPNNDGKNDMLQIPCIDQYPGSQLQIFNRWGDVVYASDNYSNDWDGTYNGGLLPAGTYFYVLKVNDNSIKAHHGYIYIQY